MSKIALSGNPSGTATYTIASPSGSTDRTLSLPDETGTVLTSGGAIDVNASAPADSLAIDASGNVGIGTSSPSSFSAKLVVNNGTNKNTTIRGAIRLAGSAIQSIQDNAATDSPLEIYTGSAQLQLEGNPITFYNGGERVRIDSSGNLLFNSGYGSVATAYGCRAWVNFNGTGTVAIRASGNVSSITDHTTGEYTVNFTTSMPDRNYAVVLGAGNTSANSCYLVVWSTPVVSSVRLLCRSDAATTIDANECNVSIFR